MTILASELSLDQASAVELAQVLSRKLAIAREDWHRLKGNEKAQAGQQISAALVFLLNDHPEEALVRLQQAIGWLEHSVPEPPCSKGH